MALIAPFRGLRYNLDKVGSMEAVVSPPYDVISPAQQDEFYLRHEFNVIRLILGKVLSGDNGTENRFSRAARTYKRWWIEEVLVRDSKPAIYLYQIDYPVNGLNGRATRKGFISLVRLEDYGQGAVKPHERTFSVTKEERLSLIGQAQANFSQIFTLYDDPQAEVISTLESAAGAEPTTEFEDMEGIAHRFEPVTDPAAIRRVAQLFSGKHLYIADGHHRYETCLNHRNRMRLQHPQAPAEASFNYTAIYATAFQDRGLSILPAHRLVKDLSSFNETSFLSQLERYFDIQEFPLEPDPGAAKRAFCQALSSATPRDNFLGFVRAGAKALNVLKLKPGVMSGVALHPSLKDLDVIVLNEIVYGRCLHLSLEDLDNERRFLYDADPISALDRVLSGEVQLGFLLN